MEDAKFMEVYQIKNENPKEKQKSIFFFFHFKSEPIFGNWKPFENDEKYFKFNLKSSFRSQDI